MANVKIIKEYPSIMIENIDILTDYYTLSQFQMIREDKEVTHDISDETV